MHKEKYAKGKLSVISQRRGGLWLEVSSRPRQWTVNKGPSAGAEAADGRLARSSMRQLVSRVPARWLARVGLLAAAIVTLVLGLRLDLTWHAAPQPGSCSETPHWFPAGVCQANNAFIFWLTLTASTVLVLLVQDLTWLTWRLIAKLQIDIQCCVFRFSALGPCLFCPFSLLHVILDAKIFIIQVRQYGNILVGYYCGVHTPRQGSWRCPGSPPGESTTAPHTPSSSSGGTPGHHKLMLHGLIITSWCYMVSSSQANVTPPQVRNHAAQGHARLAPASQVRKLVHH